MKRHTCIICGSKRYESKMKNVFFKSWACNKPKYHFQIVVCSDNIEIREAIEVIKTVSKWKCLGLSYLNESDLINCHSRTDNVLS